MCSLWLMVSICSIYIIRRCWRCANCLLLANLRSIDIGILKLELGKELFERTGLHGKPIRSGGRKHTKERYRTFLNDLPTSICLSVRLSLTKSDHA